MSYVIVGGGILGASTAYHLAKKGEQVTLIDRNDQGQATDAAAGIVCPWLSQRRNKAWYQLVKNGARYYPELVEALENDGESNTGYKRVGTISLHTDQDKLEKMVERAEKRREDAPEIGEIKLLSPEETKAMFPPLSEEYGSVYVSGGARVDGRAIRDALISAAKKYGATIIEGDAQLVAKDGQVSGVKIQGDYIEATQVIDTAGAWSKQLVEPIGVDYDVITQRAQIIHLDLMGEDTADWPVVMPPSNAYLLTFSGGRVVLGATRTDYAGFDYRATAGGIREILDKALTVAPGLDDASILETRVGFRPYTPGFLPIIGPMPNYDGLLVANGLGATGLTAGPYLGSVLADLATGEEVELDLSQYDVGEAIK
ncbi:D-amino-acid dehydrogenase [Alkalibacillus filiformis]|uniref:D-amino-acid dehydrogenase n=1 Tax=Alkalibacillus filiformis TaxID=200990 RepID=A0ABU0DTS1_9BACI|nr:FAD-dependent oxidoreductase [Alkalibacillus filiformis]MDQ0351863.1 D-amino-acid dehydrogenase [Alkalibacillus filiformis]